MHCDEFHFGLGPEETHSIKRLKGKKYCYTPENVYRKKSTRKDEKIKAYGDDDPFKTFSVFIVVGYNYRRYIQYNSNNLNGKMSSKCYTEQILPILLNDPEWIRQDLTLI